MFNLDIVFDNPEKNVVPRYECDSKNIVEWGSEDPIICIAENLPEACRRIKFFYDKWKLVKEKAYTSKQDSILEVELPNDDLSDAIYMLCKNEFFMIKLYELEKSKISWIDWFHNHIDPSDKVGVFLKRIYNRYTQVDYNPVDKTILNLLKNAFKFVSQF